MIYTSGRDPDTLELDAWCQTFYQWCRESINASGDPKKKGDGAAKWKAFERALWQDVERPTVDKRRAFSEAQSALTQLGAMHG